MSDDPLAGLPAGAELHQIAYTSGAAADAHALVVEFPPPIQRRAVLTPRDHASREPVPDSGLLLLSVPVEHLDDAGLAAAVRRWAEGENAASPGHMMTLQGAQIFWARGRLAVLAQPGRLAAVRRALVQASYYETELGDIERTLGELWPQLEADMPLAFEFNERAIGLRRQLMQRFRQVLFIRSRLARIAPHLHAPHLHPPTLASQVEERFRERTGVVHRYEFLSQQIEVFEKVYEACGQRASDFMLARSGNILEWVIIVLLATQILLAAFEILAGMGT